jgi:hypothetical protein
MTRDAFGGRALVGKTPCSAHALASKRAATAMAGEMERDLNMITS